MQVIFVDNPIQDENTKDPQLIDGKLYCWSVKPIKLRGTLSDEIAMISNKKTKYFLIHDVMSTHKYFCDQGCKSGEGCKKHYKEDDHALIVLCYVIQ